MHSYSQALTDLVTALRAGEITPAEFHEQMADLRDAEAERWIKGPHESFQAER